MTQVRLRVHYLERMPRRWCVSRAISPSASFSGMVEITTPGGGGRTGPGEWLAIMHIQDIFQSRATTFSFEFFPPKTDQASTELFATIAHLQALQPSFVSVTYGAGGSTRERTHDLVVRIQRETMLTAVSHLTCVCHSQDELVAILDRYADSAIENILALGGDLPRTLAGLRPLPGCLSVRRAARPFHPLAGRCSWRPWVRDRRGRVPGGTSRHTKPAQGT